MPLTSAGLSHRHDDALARPLDLKWVAGALVVGAIVFNAVLCFVNTKIASVGNAHVIITEALIIVLAFWTCYQSIGQSQIILIAQIVLYTLALSLIRYGLSPEEGLNLKVSRDFLIPVAFFVLGKCTNDLKAADRILFASVGLIVFFAFFEYFFLNAYLGLFAIAEYYIARGTLEMSTWALEVSKGLMVSGLRPADQGRTLLSFLGEHRVGSLFLEPSSLGNFGIIVVFWAAIRSRMEHKLYFWTILAGLVLIVLSDTRFNAYFLGLGLLILFMPSWLATPAVFAMPIVAMAGLYLFVALSDHVTDAPIIEGTGMIDRLFYSGRVLFEFDIYNWLGVKASRLQTFDAGYGYVISNAGIIGFLVFWFVFMTLRGSNRHFEAFRNVSAAYFAALFCISASQFTIKIAAPLWFLLGVLSAVKDEKPVFGPYAREHTTFDPTAGRRALISRADV